MRPVGSKYLLEEPLGRGATGTVWRARQRETAGAEAAVAGQPGETVAIKVLKEELANDPDVVMRFLRERSVLLRLTHPNIVRTRDLVVEGDLLALVMDLVDGPDLHRYLRENGPFTPIAASLLTAGIADALAASHADGIVHRDLKPANVLLAGNDSAGGRMHPMLTDFGIARLADSPGLTRTHEFVGTPAYVAPESAEGRPQTSAVDIYGAGILLYELVTGRPPFTGSSALEVLHRHLQEEPQRPGNIPDPLWTVIRACLRKNPDERPSAESLARGLRAVAAGISAHASPEQITAAVGVAALLVPDAAPTAVPGSGIPGAADPTQVLPSRGGPAGSEDRTQMLPSHGAPPMYDPNAATSMMPGAGGDRGEDRTQMMPPAQQEPEGPHPWQTQMSRLRDRNEQTQQVGYIAPDEDPLRRRPHRQVQRDQGGYGHQGYDQGPPPPQAPQRRREPQPQQRYAPPSPPQQRPPAPAPEPRRDRGRNPNRMRIPGLGCLKGCLFVLVLLFLGGWAVWELTPLKDAVAEGRSYWDQISDTYTEVKDWIGDITGLMDDANDVKDGVDGVKEGVEDAGNGLR
ncbi:protein kinase [Streptomyces sp. NPDC051940]|uniref:serine/threonine-protein kinase n=1 Tax=Streptomyces sp. NPDC051940 TaxID=3155675 RepID=UPI00342F8C2B